MAGKRLLIHSLFLLVLPIIVAAFGVSTAGALALVLVALAWRMAITLSVLLFPARVPKLELETIAASHFAEKVRWAMDRLGIEYVERQTAGVIGVLFLGRTVPQLKIRTGRVRSIVGASPDILRYLWGAYAATSGEKAAFLAPTKERLALERRLDAYGYDLQVWVYHHILADRDLSLHVWGRSSPLIPRWQRYLLSVMFPVLRAFLRKAFALSEQNYAAAVARIEALLEEIEGSLSDARNSILSGDAVDYVDMALASMTALWLQPEGFGAGKADAVRMPRERLPAEMRAEIERWIENYPHIVAFVEKLYREQRRSH